MKQQHTYLSAGGAAPVSSALKLAQSKTS
jgi:hypothetical protein